MMNFTMYFVGIFQCSHNLDSTYAKVRRKTLMVILLVFAADIVATRGNVKSLCNMDHKPRQKVTQLQCVTDKNVNNRSISSAVVHHPWNMSS